jgi:hypothetical protein
LLRCGKSTGSQVPHQSGTYVELLCVHGNSDAVTAEKAFFEHSDIDLRKVWMLLDAFRHRYEAVNRHLCAKALGGR